MKLSALFSSACLAQRPGTGMDLNGAIDFDDVFHRDNIKSLEESMAGFELLIPTNYRAIFDAFVMDNPKNQIAQNARSGIRFWIV